MNFLDAHCAIVWHTQMDVIGQQQVTDGATPFARQCNHFHFTRVRSVNRELHIG
jgi:hypothetical protein